MRKLFLTILMALMVLNSISAQTNSRLWGGIEIEYGSSLSDKKEVNGSSSSNSNSFSALHAILGYYIIKDLSIGAGIGMNGYSNPGLNTIPLYLNLKYHPFLNKKVFLDGNIGLPLATNEDNIDAKYLASLSIGYNLFKIKRVAVSPAFGFNYCKYYLLGNNGGVSNRNSLFFKVGFTY